MMEKEREKRNHMSGGNMRAVVCRGRGRNRERGEYEGNKV